MEPSLIKFLPLTVAGWVNREQQVVVEYLREENRVLKGKLPAGRRLRFSDKERRRLAVHGLDPAPVRPLQWRTFLETHWGAICAADFFTVEVLTLHGLARRHVFFVIDLKTRLVELGGIVDEPYGEWMWNVLLGLLDEVDGFLLGARYLILDRDPVYTKEVRDLLVEAGVKVVRLPARSPNLNAYAERFVGSVRRECLSKMIPLGDRHLRHAVVEFNRHYNAERNHQGLDNRLIEPGGAANGPGPIQRRKRLGGILSFYHREAA